MRISVITVTFNAAAHLSDLIESLRRQTDRDFEWIVCDGASTDGTVELIAAAEDVISNSVSEPDFGIYHAMNKGVMLATGDYYVVVGADDILYPDAIANYRRIARESEADIISASVDTSAGQALPLRGMSWLRGQSAFVSHHSVGTLIKRSLHNRYGLYSRRFPIAADQHFLKHVCASDQTRFLAANFIAGSYGLSGTSAEDVPGTMTEFFRIQLETERFATLQFLLFGLRLLRHASRVIGYGRDKRAQAVKPVLQ